jgi:non-ribosomal peptide synthetase component F
LHRHTGQNDICVGSGIANRRWRETEGLIGMIINNVVLRTDLSGNPRFRELLRQVREVTLGASTCQDLPFEQVVQALQPERDLSRNPLFQAMFSFHDSPMPDLELPEVRINLVEGLCNGSAKFDLNVIVIPRVEQCVKRSATAKGDGITLIWEYDTELFDAGTITRMIEHYQTLLEVIVDDPTQPLSDLPLLTDPERRQVLVDWNDTKRDYPRDRCIHELFEAQAERTPEAIAVVFKNQLITYGELNRRANQLAHHLQELGVGPEVLVGICMERSLEMIVGLLGILKAGGAYVPLDPAYPKERVAFILEDTRAPVLLTQSGLLGQLPAIRHSPSAIRHSVVMCLDTDWQVISREEETKPLIEGTADNVAYVICAAPSTWNCPCAPCSRRPR